MKSKKIRVTITVDPHIFEHIEKYRGREKRSTFIEECIKKGMLEFYEKRREK